MAFFKLLSKITYTYLEPDPLAIILLIWINGEPTRIPSFSFPHHIKTINTHIFSRKSTVPTSKCGWMDELILHNKRWCIKKITVSIWKKFGNLFLITFQFGIIEKLTFHCTSLQYDTVIKNMREVRQGTVMLLL